MIVVQTRQRFEPELDDEGDQGSISSLLLLLKELEDPKRTSLVGLTIIGRHLRERFEGGGQEVGRDRRRHRALGEARHPISPTMIDRDVPD